MIVQAKRVKTLSRFIVIPSIVKRKQTGKTFQSIECEQEQSSVRQDSRK